MGLDSLKALNAAQAAQATQAKQNANGSEVKVVTVPIGQQADKKPNEVPMGLGVERTVQGSINYNEVENGYTVYLKNERTLTDKKAYKEAVERVQNQILENGLANGEKITDKKEAKKLAEAYVKNEKNKENFYATRTFDNEHEYEVAQRAREMEKKKLVEQYRSEGLGRKEANAKAENRLIKNEYVKNKKARNYMAEHAEEFYENGKLSQVKTKMAAMDMMNVDTTAEEVQDNAYLSLKERRKVAAERELNNNAVADIVHRTGGGFEKDHTELIQAAAIVGTTAALAGAGAAVTIASTASSVAGTVAGSAAAGTAAGAAAGATATAEAAVNMAVPGAIAGAGIGTGLTRWLKDPGNKEPQVYAPAKAENKPPVEPEVQPEIQPEIQPEVEPEVEPEVQPEVEPEVQPEVEPAPCKVIVQNGESLAKLSKKYGVPVETIIELNKNQIKYFHNSKNCADNKKIAGFLVGAEINMPNGCDKADGNKDAAGARKDYEKAVLKQYPKLCGTRRDTEVTNAAFRKQHKIGEFTPEK